MGQLKIKSYYTVEASAKLLFERNKISQNLKTVDNFHSEVLKRYIKTNLIIVNITGLEM